MHPYVLYFDVLEDDGIAAQGHANPPAVFAAHWITKSGGKYYDPSYGTPVISDGDIDVEYVNSTFAGFAKLYPTTGGESFYCMRVRDVENLDPEVKFEIDN